MCVSCNLTEHDDDDDPPPPVWGGNFTAETMRVTSYCSPLSNTLSWRHVHDTQQTSSRGLTHTHAVDLVCVCTECVCIEFVCVRNVCVLNLCVYWMCVCVCVYVLNVCMYWMCVCTECVCVCVCTECVCVSTCTVFVLWVFVMDLKQSAEQRGLCWWFPWLQGSVCVCVCGVTHMLVNRKRDPADVCSSVPVVRVIETFIILE